MKKVSAKRYKTATCLEVKPDKDYGKKLSWSPFLTSPNYSRESQCEERKIVKVLAK